MVPTQWGEQRMLVAMCNYPDDAPVVGAAQRAFFDPENPYGLTTYWREASAGRTWFTGEAYPVRFSLTEMDPVTEGLAGISRLARRELAKIPGVDLAAWPRFAYVCQQFPGAYIGISGLGSPGAGSPSQMWLQQPQITQTVADAGSLGAFLHEMGHCMCFVHNNDPADLMGFGSYLIAAPHRHFLGYLGQAEVSRVANDLSVRLFALDSGPASNTKALLIASGDTDLYVSYRQRSPRLGVAAILCPDRSGVDIHRYRLTEWGRSTGDPFEPAPEYLAVLSDGQAWQDPITGAKIQQTSHVSGGDGFADVQITFPGGTPSPEPPPTLVLDITSVAISANPQWVKASWQTNLDAMCTFFCAGTTVRTSGTSHSAQLRIRGSRGKVYVIVAVAGEQTDTVSGLVP